MYIDNCFAGPGCRMAGLRGPTCSAATVRHGSAQQPLSSWPPLPAWPLRLARPPPLKCAASAPFPRGGGAAPAPLRALRRSSCSAAPAAWPLRARPRELAAPPPPEWHSRAWMAGAAGRMRDGTGGGKAAGRVQAELRMRRAR
eukprot:scaffold6916_cov119-Isochrysis_galbana.AAC.3